MGLGLGLPYAIGNLQDLLAQRKAEQIAAQMRAESIRQFNVRSAETARQHDLNLQQHQLMAQAQTANLAERSQQHLGQEAERVAEMTPAGPVPSGGDFASALQAGKLGHLLTAQPNTLPSTQMAGIVAPQPEGQPPQGSIRSVTPSPGVPAPGLPSLYLGTAKQAQAGAALKQAAQLRQDTLKSQADIAAANQTAAGERTSETNANRMAIAGVAAANRPDRNLARTDKSYQQISSRLDALTKPVLERQGRLQRLEDTLAQNSPQADALVAPELLTAMAGGQGSGLRMNEAEIARIVGGRTNWESLKAAANKWSLNPATAVSITSEQRRQIRELLRATKARNDASLTVIQDAGNRLTDAQSAEEHRHILDEVRKTLLEGTGPASTAATQLSAEELIRKYSNGR